MTLALSVSAQSPLTNEQPHTAYFLIDTSGSMSDVQSLLQSTVDDQLNLIEAQSPSTVVVPSFFGADDQVECDMPVAFEEPIRSSDALLVPNASYKLYTPIGSALASAIKDAGTKRATIFIFSDEEQTELCGIDVCEVAKSYLPRPNIEVVSVSVGSDPEDTDRLGCIAGAQSSASRGASVQDETSDTASQLKPDAQQETRKSGWDDYSVPERLPFVFMLFFFVSAAVSWQFYYGHKAVHVEDQILALEQKHEGSVASGADDTQEINDPKRKPWQRADFWLLVAGLIILLFLAFYPRGLGDMGQFAYQARSIAWIVLNSNFATAFSLLAVSPLLFAGAQFWRYSQARQKFLVVSGMYSAQQSVIREQKRLAALTELQSMRRKVETLDFRAPPAPKVSIPSLKFLSQRRSISFAQTAQSVDLDLWERACQAARAFAVSPAAPSTIDAIEKETARLNRYVRQPGGRSKHLADTVDLLLEDKLIGSDVGNWSTLAKDIRSLKTHEINSALRSISSPAKN